MAARNDFDDFLGDDEGAPVTDTRADGRLYRVPLTRLSPNLVNPRKDFGTEDALIDFGKSLQRRQNQACPVVSRNAYLKLWPDHRDQVKDVDYILVSGERRYRAANAVGLAVLDCVVNDDFAADRKTFMEAVVSENVDRRNFDPIEEAYAVQALVAEFGSNRAVAEHFERVDGWVTQRILLTHLAPDVQDLVRKKALPLEPARSLGKLARDKVWGVQEQMQWWEEEQGRKAVAAAARTAARKEAKQEPVVAPAPPERPGEPTADTAPAAAAPVSAPPPAPSFTAVKQPEPEPVRQHSPDTAEPAAPRMGPTLEPAAAETIPEPRQDAGREDLSPRGRTLPYDDGTFIGHHLVKKVDNGPFLEVAQVIYEQCWDKVGVTSSIDLLRGMLETACERDPDAVRLMLAEVTSAAPAVS
jgi:ParB family chromosome partitioning protein